MSSVPHCCVTEVEWAEKDQEMLLNFKFWNHKVDDRMEDIMGDIYINVNKVESHSIYLVLDMFQPFVTVLVA